MYKRQTPEREIILLEQFVTRLDEEKAAFLEAFPGCTRGAQWFEMEANRTQEHIAKLIVSGVHKEFESEKETEQ